MKLFVYGTLMIGQNAHTLLENSDFISNCWTFGKLTIKDDGYVYLNPNQKELVRGELYEINDQVLKEITEYEGLSYELKEIECYMPPFNFKPVKCNAFVEK